ncbi:MAG: hypothetical protein MUP27_00625 [Desulfobacterales bacterium]|jgi:hypothetical protein|nr:hypothetical protein [Desulfobacterales bacterium]
MPRRERDQEIARRRKRKKESRKLRAKALLEQPAGSVKESEKKKPEKAPAKETTPMGSEETGKPSTPRG